MKIIGPQVKVVPLTQAAFCHNGDRTFTGNIERVSRRMNGPFEWVFAPNLEGDSSLEKYEMYFHPLFRTFGCEHLNVQMRFSDGVIWVEKPKDDLFTPLSVKPVVVISTPVENLIEVVEFLQDRPRYCAQGNNCCGPTAGETLDLRDSVFLILDLLACIPLPQDETIGLCGYCYQQLLKQFSTLGNYVFFDGRGLLFHARLEMMAI